MSNLYVTMPLNRGQRYYAVHYLYFKKLMEFAGCSISYSDSPDNDLDLGFIASINGNRVIIDYADNIDVNVPNEENLPVFKFHKRPLSKDNIHPFAPISFMNWKEYFDLESSINYSCKTYKVLNAQRPYGNALERREEVRRILMDRFGQTRLDFSVVPQEEFWNKVNSMLVSVHVPGQNNNMIDRGQLQLMGLGCCTISPELPEQLPNNLTLNPGEHYFQCRNDYSDLVKIIKWCRSNKELCVEVGQNAKKLFQQSCTPKAVLSHIKKCINII